MLASGAASRSALRSRSRAARSAAARTAPSRYEHASQPTLPLLMDAMQQRPDGGVSWLPPCRHCDSPHGDRYQPRQLLHPRRRERLDRPRRRRWFGRDAQLRREPPRSSPPPGSGGRTRPVLADEPDLCDSTIRTNGRGRARPADSAQRASPPRAKRRASITIARPRAYARPRSSTAVRLVDPLLLPPRSKRAPAGTGTTASFSGPLGARYCKATTAIAALRPPRRRAGRAAAAWG
jgi:hypothetical protein